MKLLDLSYLDLGLSILCLFVSKYWPIEGQSFESRLVEFDSKLVYGMIIGGPGNETASQNAIQFSVINTNSNNVLKGEKDWIKWPHHGAYFICWCWCTWNYETNWNAVSHYFEFRSLSMCIHSGFHPSSTHVHIHKSSNRPIDYSDGNSCHSSVSIRSALEEFLTLFYKLILKVDFIKRLIIVEDDYLKKTTFDKRLIYKDTLLEKLGCRERWFLKVVNFSNYVLLNFTSLVKDPLCKFISTLDWFEAILGVNST